MFFHKHHQLLLLITFSSALLVAVSSNLACGQDAKPTVLRIGASGAFKPVSGNQDEALKSLQSFIKDETGFANEIVQQKSWQEVADKMSKKEFQIGVFQGHEFAWAQEKHPELRPLALAVNVYTYPVVYIVAKRDDAAKDFAGLKGQSLTLADAGQDDVRLFVQQQCQANGKKPEQFFSKVTSTDNVEDALDNVVDGKVQAVAADRAALEAYKQRKPGRFNQLKEVAASQPMPPPVVAYYDKALDEATLQRFRQGLLNAGNTDRGQTLLTLYRLTGFVALPEDFNKVIEETRKTYPPGTQEK